MARVIVTEEVHPDALALLRGAGWQVVGPGAEPAPAEAILVRTRRLAAAEVGLVQMISKHGVGVDNIPLEAARAAGVAVMNTPGANAAAVAEQTLMLMLVLARDLPAQEAAARAGQRAPAFAGLDGRRLLIVGRGATGRRVGQLAAGFGMETLWLAPGLTGAAAEGLRVVPDLRAALPGVDVVTLHCPLTPATRGMIGAAELAALPAGALVVNVARGGLIDEVALVAALRSGHLGGAALDVTEREPLPADHPLLSAPRLRLTPHAAGLGAGAFRRMGMEAAQNILDHFAGRPRAGCVVV